MDIKISNYFSTGYILLSVLFLLFGIGAIVRGEFILGIILMLPLIITSSTHYRLQIDDSKKIYKFYVWLLGSRIGKEYSFERIEYVYLKKNRVSQTMHMESLSSTVKKEVYDIYLKFSDRKPLHLLDKNDYKAAREKLHSIASAFNIDLVDHIQ